MEQIFCRTPECNDDGGDCPEGGHICTNVLLLWSVLFSTSDTTTKSNYDHETLCENQWNQAMSLEFNGMDAQNNTWRENCTRSLKFVDLNGDSHLNAREATLIAGIATGGSIDKYLGINCSSVFSEWNPRHED